LKEFSKKNVIGAVLGQLFFWHKIFDKEAWIGKLTEKKYFTNSTPSTYRLG
jgi:hypothetical protein